jgi:hypothetical protein
MVLFLLIVLFGFIKIKSVKISNKNTFADGNVLCQRIHTNLYASILHYRTTTDCRSDQTTDYKIDICCFSVKHAALRRKSKDWLARNQNNRQDLNQSLLLFLIIQLIWIDSFHFTQ